MAAAGGGRGAGDALGFAFHVFRGRWFMVFVSFLIMSAAGATYMFGIYSGDIKTSLGYNQQTLNTLSFFKDLGANVGVISGLINEVTPPWVVLLIGAAMNFGGYFMIYLAITGRISRPAVWNMCLYICIGANSQTFANTGALVTCVKNFPESRGVVLGLLKGFVGLSGAIITQLYYAFYDNDSKAVLLLIAWLPAVISVASIGTIRIMKVVRQPSELRTFYSFLYISLALAAYLMVMIIIEKRLNFAHSEYDVSAAIVVFLLLLPIAIVVREEASLWKQKKESLNNTPSVSIAIEKPLPSTILATTSTNTAEPPPSSATLITKSSSAFSYMADTLRPPARGDDYSILQALFSIDMLVLFFATMCGVGGTLTAIDNMGQIGESLGYPKRSISTFVSLISIWNYMGRVAAGFVSEIFLARYKFPRPLMLTLILLLSCVGHLLIAFGVPGSLYVSSVIIGFCFGAQWPLLYAIISEIFGLKYYSTLYNFGGVASPIGSYILNVRVAGNLYDKEAVKQNNRLKVPSVSHDLKCIGVQCFKLSFLIITAVTILGALVSLVLVWRTKNFYRGDIYKKFREAAGEGESGLVTVNVNVVGKEGEEERPSSSSSESKKKKIDDHEGKE